MKQYKNLKITLKGLNKMMEQIIEGIEYTEIPVFDLEQAIDWYCNKLGAKLGFRNARRKHW